MIAANPLAGLARDRPLVELSLWSANLLDLGGDLARTDALADLYHIDVADGHFAPAMLLFPDLVASVRKATRRPLHVHLMVQDSILLSQIQQFADAGADLISVHLENGSVLSEAIDLIDRCGVAAGIVLRVETPVAQVAAVLPRVASVTLLGTAIGVKGQGLADSALGRLLEARRLIAAAGQSDRTMLVADGGIREHTVPTLYASGADAVVMGSLAFGAPDLAARIAWARGLSKPAS